MGQRPQWRVQGPHFRLTRCPAGLSSEISSRERVLGEAQGGWSPGGALSNRRSSRLESLPRRDTGVLALADIHVPAGGRELSGAWHSTVLAGMHIAHLWARGGHTKRTSLRRL